jgi:cation-transporting ATPase E
MLSSQIHQGLSSDEVATRKAAGKGTIMPPSTGRTYAQIVREDVFTLINNILFGLCIALLLLGQISEALVSAGTVLFNVIISVIQEVRAKRTLDHITLLTRPKATVMRDGREHSIDPSEIVQDDILVLHPGDQIVADGPIVGNSSITVDESLLTGESDPVTKQSGDMLHSGSFCITGSAYYQAEKLGIESISGQLTAKARAFRRAYTPLQREINLIIQSLLLVALYIETVLVLISLVQQTPIVDTVRMSVVVIGIVPIGLFLATSVAYALGALHLAGRSALVQRLSAIESLSNVDILCLDKTGTLTTNALQLERLLPLGITEAELRHLLGLYTANSSSKNATSAAIAAACDVQPSYPLHIREEVPFSSERKWSALSIGDAALRGVYVLGAPEILYPFLQPGTDLSTFLQEEAARGMRVLLFAFLPDPLPLRTAEAQPVLPHDMRPLGMISLRDELRSHVRETIARFTTVGIQVKIISGDNPLTVAALARQVGIANSEKIVSQEELARMDDAQLARTAEEQTIFGRVIPQEKERLVQALRHRHHYVAMIGDGVNDVLSLKQADLAIAMESGSQAARGVADIVLLKNSFAALPSAFSEGQRIRNGMYNVIKLFLARVTYLALLLITIPISGGFPFAPKQKSILTFVTASIITVALAAWARPGPSPQGRSGRIFLRFVLPAALTQSLVAFAVYLVAFHLAQQQLHATFADALLIAQSALTAFAVFSGLLLVPFIVPPTRFWTGGSPLSGDWRPTLLALGLSIVYLIMVTIPVIRTFFSLTGLDPLSYFLLGCTTLIWGLSLRWIWRFHLLERFLQLDRQQQNDESDNQR